MAKISDAIEITFGIEHTDENDHTEWKVYKTAKAARAAAIRKSRAKTDIVYACIYANGDAIGHISYYAGLIDTKEGQAVID